MTRCSTRGGWPPTSEPPVTVTPPARYLNGVLEGGEVTFATVRGQDASVTARGRGVVHAGWLGVSSLWTAPDHRGRGLGSAVLRSLLEWGSERGASTTYLQVVEANTAALALYEARGFERHHDYAYYVAPG